MMSKTQVKNQDSSKFQQSKSHSIKIQDMQEPQEKYQDKYKKNFSKKRLNNTIFQKNFLKKNLLPEFLLSSNRLPEAQNSFITVLQSTNPLPWTCNRLPMFLNVEFQESQLVMKHFQTCVIDYTTFVINYQYF